MEQEKMGWLLKDINFFPKSVPGIIIYLIFPLDLKMILQGKLNAFPWTEAAKRCILSAGFGVPAPRQWDMYNYRSWLKWSVQKQPTHKYPLKHEGQALSLLKFLFPLNTVVFLILTVFILHYNYSVCNTHRRKSVRQCQNATEN